MLAEAEVEAIIVRMLLEVSEAVESGLITTLAEGILALEPQIPEVAEAETTLVIFQEVMLLLLQEALEKLFLEYQLQIIAEQRQVALLLVRTGLTLFYNTRVLGAIQDESFCKSRK